MAIGLQCFPRTFRRTGDNSYSSAAPASCSTSFAMAATKRNNDDEDNEDTSPATKQRRVIEDDEQESTRSSPPSDELKVPEAGIIQQVHVENFMCHRKFTVDFCRHVNFITGQNGSGKSAILAALQVCLGASRTTRGRSLSDLVRRDGTSQPTHAIVRVALLNKGSDAFKPEVYGDTVVVERIINAKGGSHGYKLYGADGMEKSRERKELVALLDQL